MAVFAMYAATYHIDYQINYPYRPFKLKKQKSFISRYLIICKNRKRGMVNIAFILEILAHFFLIMLSAALLFIYILKWYKLDSFYNIYRMILLGIVFCLFALPGAVSVSIHNYFMKKDNRG